FLDLAAGGGLRLRVNDPANDNFDFTTAAAVSAGTWTDVAVRVDKLTHRAAFFINGSLFGGTVDWNPNLGANGNATSLTNAVNLGIGSSPTIANLIYGGNLDDLRLYKVALTDAEVFALAQGANSVSSSVKLVTGSALATATSYSVKVSGVQDVLGNAMPAA